MNENQKPILLQDLGILFTNDTKKYKTRDGIYKCRCSNEFKANTAEVKRGKIQTCGCINHKLSNTKLYDKFLGMKSRCYNQNREDYKDYGERGITICDEWLNDFVSFYNWAIENGYKDGLEIDRRDNNLGYTPSNCRFVNRTIQTRNTRILRRDNSSGFRGVSFRKNINKWTSKIRVNKKDKHLGYFNTALDAGLAYDKYVTDNNLEHTKNFN